MLQITPHHRFFLGIEPLDFRKGIDAIAAYCKQRLQTDPMSGAWFVFANRGRTAVKLLVYDGQGYWLCMKRFSQGRLAWWPKDVAASQSISAQHLQILLYQGDPSMSKIPADWKRI
jgi:transposase